MYFSIFEPLEAVLCYVAKIGFLLGSKSCMISYLTMLNRFDNYVVKKTFMKWQFEFFRSVKVSKYCLFIFVSLSFQGLIWV